MTNITAVELRNNLEDVIKRAVAGESFRVTYRGGLAVRIAADTMKKDPKTLSGLDAFLASTRKQSKLDPNKSIKELYHEHLDGKYDASN